MQINREVDIYTDQYSDRRTHETKTTDSAIRNTDAYNQKRQKHTDSHAKQK